MTIQSLFFEDDGLIPNSPLPVLLHRGLTDSAAKFEARFTRHGWPAQWRGGVFDYHHYHSTAHEVLGVVSGTAELVLGGANGQRVEVESGDVLILPAGTGHCRLAASPNFLLVGAYPADQQDWDLCRPEDTDITQARQRIERVGQPALNPVDGAPLASYWR